MMVTVPPDKKAGDTFIFNVPAPAAQPTPAVALAQPVVAMGQVMPQQAMPQQAMGQQVMGQQHMVQPVMVIQQPVHHHPQYFGRYSAVTQCPTCRHTGPTNVVFDPGCGTWLVCGALALVGCWMGCCLVPFCMDDCKDATHQCASCHRVVGEKRLIS